MAEVNIHNVLVVGTDVVSLAASARRAGYRVYAVDYFGDQDLKRVCHESRSIVNQRRGKTCGKVGSDFSPETLLQLTKDLLRKEKIDAALLSSGLDDSSDVLSELNDSVTILGSHPKVIGKVRDKMEFFQELKRLGIPHPETVIVDDSEEAKKRSKDIGYPVVVKPLSGFGGTGIRKVQSRKELEKAFREVSFLNGKVLIQEYISGTPASASLISSTERAVVLTLNEQLLGMRKVGQREPFGYCGNIVPLSATTAIADACKSVVEKVILHFCLVGSNGVDLVISDAGIPYVIEVNPRFQGTLECVERVLRTNLVRAHIEACVQRVLPTIVKEISIFCIRLILYAPERLVAPDLNTFEWVNDVPLPGIIIEDGEPICSVVMEGVSRGSSLRKAMIITKRIYSLLRQKLAI